MKKVYIRVDGNEIIATGHVMRCLSIAEQLRKLGAEVIFLVADERPCSLIENKGFLVEVLGTVWNDFDSEIELLCNYIEQHSVRMILLDSYYATKQYMERLSKYTCIVYIDDLSRELYPVHTIVKYNIFADYEEYERRYNNAGMDTKCLIGSKFIPLREEFMYQPYKVKQDVSQVLITTGGTDQLDLVYHLLQEFISNPMVKPLEYQVVIGCFNKNKEQLFQMENKYPNIHIHENVSNISEWMRSCDIAVSAAGTTAYELCACGIPSICLTIADNQDGAVKWQKYGYMKYAGNAYKDMQQCVKMCKEMILEYSNNYEERKQKSAFMQSLVDGYGAKRIAEYMLNI